MTDSIFANPSPVEPGAFDLDSHAWGMKFTVSEDADCVGGRAWVPAAGRPTTFLWQLWRVGDSTKIAESNLNAVGHGTPTSGAWYSFDSTLFATPGDVALSSAQEYRVCVAFQDGNGVYTDDGSETFPTGTGVVSASTGSFTNNGGTNVMPGTDYDAWFFADVTVDTGGAEPSEVTLTPAVVTLTAQALTATPGVVTVNLTPAIVTLTAQELTATPGMVAVALTPAAVSLAAQPLTATPGMVTVALTPATITLAAQVLGTGQDVFTSITVGKPRGRWHTGQPQGRWNVGRPRGA